MKTQGIRALPAGRDSNWHANEPQPMHETAANDPPPTSQFTNDNPLTDLQDRQRAPLKHLRRCLENHTRNESSMSEISDMEVANPHTDSDHAWSTCENDSQH